MSSSKFAGKFFKKTPLYGAYSLVKNGNYLYVTSYTSDSLTVIDVSTPTNPTYSASIINNAGTRLDGPRGIEFDGSHVYITSFDDDALQVIDVSTPTSPTAA